MEMHTAAAGKGSLINELIREIDPRFFGVVSPVLPPETEDRYPFLYRYAAQIPENGKIMFYDSGWMEGAVRRYLRRENHLCDFLSFLCVQRTHKTSDIQKKSLDAAATYTGNYL